MASRAGYLGRDPSLNTTTVSRQLYTPTGVQTSFTFYSGYDPGYIDVFLNGLRMVEGQDYNAQDSKTITLINPAVNGDCIEAQAYKTFNVGNQLKVGIQSAGNLIGTVDTINFVGHGNTFHQNGSTINVDISGGQGGSYANIDVDAHLNVGTATTNQILSWNGSDYAWVADQTQTSVIDTHLNVGTAVSNQILSWDGSDYAWVADQTGGGGGGGTGYFSNDQTNSGIHTTSLHVGIGTTNPQTQIQIGDSYGVQSFSGSWNAVAGVAKSDIGGWTIANTDFKSAEYTFWFNFQDGRLQSQKALTMHNGTTAYVQQFAIMNTGLNLINIDAEIYSGNFVLKFVPESGVTGVVTYIVRRETLL